MDTLQQAALLVELAERRSKREARFGKTAAQKLLYLLQEGLGVNLGYRFSLYTYGPYASAVMGDIDYCAAIDLLSVKYDDLLGYQIEPGPRAAEVDSHRQAFMGEHAGKLNRLFELFGSLNAADLELRATLLYVHHDAPKADEAEVVRRTCAIKPRFVKKVVVGAAAEMREAGLIAA
jgi:uncharacterized protein YwgA